MAPVDLEQSQLSTHSYHLQMESAREVQAELLSCGTRREVFKVQA